MNDEDWKQGYEEGARDCTTNQVQPRDKRIADLEAALKEVVGCFSAADAEGLMDALQSTNDDRLRDLYVRRLMHAYVAAQAALENK